MPIVRIFEETPKARVIGYLEDREGIFKKSVWLSKHLFRVLDSWGIDGAYFRDVLYPNGYKVQIWEREEDEVYEATAEDIKKHGQYYHFKNEKEDHRAQIFLPRRYWLKLSKKDQKIRDFYLKHCI